MYRPADYNWTIFKVKHFGQLESLTQTMKKSTLVISGIVLFSRSPAGNPMLHLQE
jgi:hypothetical protein